MKIFYRISENSYVKPKLPGTNKLRCLDNFIGIFGKDIIVVADNCTDKLVEKIRERSPACIVTSELGNAGSFGFALTKAIGYDKDELIYFVEDDYFHFPKAPQLLEEGIQLADYTTIYDHPDKYTKLYEFGEHSKVVRSTHRHWRYTQSTTMTFAARAGTLKEDMAIWWKHTNGQHPQDHECFTALRETGRKLSVCIPGEAYHLALDDSCDAGIDERLVDAMTDIVKKAIFQMHDGDAEDAMVDVLYHNHDLSKLAKLACIAEIENAFKMKRASESHLPV